MEATAASLWPAQRQPARWEAVDSHQGPADSVVERFRTALMHGEGDAVRHNASSLDLDACLATPIAETDLGPHTYPLTLLYGLQALPTDDELAVLRRGYCDTFASHVYVSKIHAEEIVARSNPPYMQLTLAVSCIASIFSESPTEKQDTAYAVSEQLFQAGFHLWLAMVEVDGRETRSARTVIAVGLNTAFSNAAHILSIQ